MNPILRYLSESAKKHTPDFTSVESGMDGYPEGVETICDLEYCGENGTSLFADLFRLAERKEEKLPIAIFVHGGGLFAGDRKMNVVFCGKLAAAGYLVFSIEYRLITETDAFGEFSDVCAGLAFVEKEAEVYGGDRNQIFLIGESAGAYLSLFASAMAGSDSLRKVTGCSIPPVRVRGLIAFSGMFYTEKLDVIGLVYKKSLYGEKTRDIDLVRLMDPENPEIISSLPPVFLTSSKGDFLRTNTLRFASALKKAGHPCKVIYYKDRKDLGHAFPSLTPSKPESAAVLKKMDRWVKTLQGKPEDSA